MEALLSLFGLLVIGKWLASWTYERDCRLQYERKRRKLGGAMERHDA